MKLVLLVVAVLGACSAVWARPARPVLGVDRAYLNSSVSACQDFYGYANGAYDKAPIPGEYAEFGVNQEINERSYAILKDILETAAKSGGPRDSIAQHIGDFYAAGMNEPAIEREGLSFLSGWFQEIAAIDSTPALVATVGHLQALGFEVAFGFGVRIDDKNSTAMIGSFGQGGLGLPERDYYLRPGTEAEAIRQAYAAHVARTLELAGATATAAQSSADAIMALETKLARASRTLVELRDPEKNYHKFNRTDLPALTTDFDWERFLAQINFPAAEKTVLVGQPEFFTALGGFFRTEPLAIWRDYLRWQVLRQTASYLTRAFVDEQFAFYGRKLSGATELRPRWKRVMDATDRAIGEDLGQLFVQRTFSAAAKTRALNMVKYHLEAMRGRIRAAIWMSEATKANAYRKIELMRVKVGFPDHWRDYSALKLTRDSYVSNATAAAAFEFRRQLAKLGQPVDRSEWQMTPQTNNAYYEPALNEMCFPAGILQPPFFDEKADDASNYGALASTIGHELTHGFDDEGRQYDAEGNLRNWWTDFDAQGFKERAENVAKQYDAYEVLPGLHIDGRQTLGENIADVGGLRVSYDAFKLATAGKKLPSIDGFTSDQRFFIAFAQSWRTNQRPEQVRLILASDVHSPVRWRVLGPVAYFPEFRAAFGCPTAVPPGPPIW